MAKKTFLSKITEDWWAVIIGLLLILLAAIGWLGETGLNIKF
jgi:hypothetical protein